MNKILAVSLFFLAAVPAGAYKAGDVMPCDSAMAIEGMCKYGGTYTVVATDQRNQEEYEQSAAMWARLRSKGCELEMDNMGLCCNRDNFPAVIPTPCPGARAVMNKVYKFNPPSWRRGPGDPNQMSLNEMMGAGEGTYSSEIYGCGVNPIYASLKDPAASCDRTAQDIVNWSAFVHQNPLPGIGCVNNNCYMTQNGVKADITSEAYDAIVAQERLMYNFKLWEQTHHVPVDGAASSSNSAAASAAPASSAKKLSGGGFKPFATGSSTPNAAGQTGGLVIGGGVHPETVGQIAQ